MKYILVPEKDFEDLKIASRYLNEFLKSGSNHIGRFYPETFVNITDSIYKIITSTYYTMLMGV